MSPDEAEDLPGPSTMKLGVSTRVESPPNNTTEDTVSNLEGLDILGPLIVSFWDMDRDHDIIDDQTKLGRDVELEDITRYIISILASNDVVF